MNADRVEIGRFVRALFCHADADGYVSLRTFEHQRGAKPVEIRAVQINGEGLDAVVAKATGAANRAAKFERPTVFAPPVCTFRSATKAAEADLANGLCLAIECDDHPTEACGRLIGLLGGVTAIVASGGEWAHPETGELEPRLHVYVRLREPTRTPEEHAQLKRANRLAAALVGSDPSAVPLVHPLRWAGSVHRKGQPKLCRIADLHEFEIDLADALERLEQAARLALDIHEARASASLSDYDRARLRFALDIHERFEARASGAPEYDRADPDASDPDLEALADAIPNADEPRAEWIKVGLAFFAASEGHAAGFNAWDRWSRKSGKAHGGTVAQWAQFAKSPPNRTDKGALVQRARRTNPDFRLPSWGPAPQSDSRGDEGHWERPGDGQDKGEPSPETTYASPGNDDRRVRVELRPHKVNAIARQCAGLLAEVIYMRGPVPSALLRAEEVRGDEVNAIDAKPEPEPGVMLGGVRHAETTSSRRTMWSGDHGFAVDGVVYPMKKKKLSKDQNRFYLGLNCNG